MAKRTFGWIQDAGRLGQLRKAVEVFSVEKLNATESQKIVGDALNIGRWADENYTRFAEALGYVEYDRETDDFSITDLGIDLLNSKPKSDEEKRIFEIGLLSYPPACRVLDLLVRGTHLTKFEIGEKLGFQNERGFLHYPQEQFVKEHHNAKTHKEKNRIISNKESTIDKYARMIAGYLSQMRWVEPLEKELIYVEGKTKYSARIPHAYKITDRGRQAYRKAAGTSTQRKIWKNISYEMLASRKQAGSSLLRQRRALILEFLNKKRGKAVDMHSVKDFLDKNDVDCEENEIIKDIEGLINTGVLIQKIGSKFILTEKLKLNFPLFKEDINELNKEVEKSIRRLHSELTHITRIDCTFVDKILREAYSGTTLSREFEKSVYRLFNEIIGFEGILLGGPREPDSLFWYRAKTKDSSYGLIVDAKAYSTGFKITSNAQRAMVDYIYNFRDVLEKEYKVKNTHYIWATSYYNGTKKKFNFHINQIEKQSSAKGSLLPMNEGLYLAEKVNSYKKGVILGDIEPLFCSNEVITRKTIDSII